jgi:acetylornithine deacetylase/succinyl-diaminopimelate desuccinylase-like protein
VIPATREQLAAEAKLEKGAVAEAEARVSVSGRVTEEDDKILSTDRFANARIRTTCVTTQLKGSPQDNVLPTSAEATVNCRILPDETREATRETLQRAIADPRVEITPLADDGVGPPVDVAGEVPDAIRRVAASLWPAAVVVPTMSTGATDSRHLRAVGIRAYGTNVSPLTKAESAAGHGAHGPDERRPARWLADGARFLRELTYELAR